MVISPTTHSESTFREQLLADLPTPLDSDSATMIAEAVKNANFTPWQLIVLILGGIFLWNLKGLYSIHVAKYKTSRKYDLLDKKADDKIRMMKDKKKARLARPTVSKKVGKP